MIRRTIQSAIALCVAHGFFQDVFAAETIVSNGGFESGATGWWGGALSKSGGVVAAGAAEGVRCLKMAGDYACQDKMLIAGGKRYRVEMKIRCDGAPKGSVYVQLSYRGGSLQPAWYGPQTVSLGDHAEKALFIGDGVSEWTSYSTVVLAPGEADQMLLYLRKTAGSAGFAAFDDVRVTPISAPETGAGAKALLPRGEVVANGGFEEGAAHWWGGGLKSGGVVPEGAASGNKCLKMVGDFVCQDKRPVTGGQRYRFSVKIRCQDAPEGSAYVQLSYRGGSLQGGWFGPDRVDLGSRKEKAVFVTGGTHGWQTFSLVLEAPEAADQALIYLRKKDGTQGAAYYDDVRMTPTDDPATTALDVRREALASQWLSAALPPGEALALLEKAQAAGRQPSPPMHVLARNGVAACRVHVGSAADVRVLNAAHELAETLGKISGGDFMPLSHDAHPLAGPLLVVGRDTALTRLLCPDIPYDTLGEDGFVIRTAGPHVVIAGKTPGGTMYGVSWLLDRKLGVKWLSPDYTHVPASKTLALPTLRETQVPRFAFRQILSYEGQDKPFAAHNLLNGNSHGAYSILPSPEIDHWESAWQRPGLTASFYDLMPPGQHQKAHPEWFAGGQVAMMNPEVRAHMAGAIVKRLSAVPDYASCWFGFMDNDWGWDMDPASATFARAHGDTPAAPRLDMAIDVANRVRKVLPGARIAVNAYHWSFPPPAGLAVPDFVLVYPMTIHVDYSSPLNKGRNAQLGRDVEGWCKITPNLLLWDHIVNFHGYLQPTPNIYPIGESLQWLASLPSVRGYFAEGSWNTPGAEFASLRVWMMSRLLWDPKTDVRAAVAEYCDAYFGPAGKAVKSYIDLMHETAAETRAPIWEKTNVDSPMLNLEFVAKADALLAQAEAAVANEPVLLGHVRQVRSCVDYVVLLRRHEFSSNAKRLGVAWSADTQSRLARFNQTVQAEGVTQYRQGGKNMDELAAIIRIERKDAAPPALVKGVPPSDWKEIQDLGFNRYYDSTVIVADSQASDGAAARLDGHSSAWVIQAKMHLVPEEGEWNIYAEVRVDAEGARDEDAALCVGHAPPMGRTATVPYGKVKGEGYHLVQIPDGPFRHDAAEGAISYITGPNAKNIRHIYVDRFFMVRVRK